MTDQTDELAGRLEAVRQLLSAQDDRQTKLHDLLETIREQIRLGVKPEHRPEGLFKNIQDAVYAMRGRMPLLNDAAITSPLDEAAAALRALRAERDERAGWVTHWQTKCQSTAGLLTEARATIATQAKEIEALREALYWATKFMSPSVVGADLDFLTHQPAINAAIRARSLTTTKGSKDAP